MFGPTLTSVKFQKLALPSTTLGSADRPQVIQHLLAMNHVAVLRVYVVEVRLVGLGVAIAHGLAGYDGPEAVLEGVDGRGPHATRGRGSRDNERVHPGGGEEAGETGSEEAGGEEAGGEELVEDGLRLAGFIQGWISAQRVPASRVSSIGTL